MSVRGLNGRSRFDDLIAPVDPAHFFETIWQRSPLLIRAVQPERFSVLLPLEEVDVHLTERRLGQGRVRMARGGATTLESASYTRSDGSFDPLRGLDLYRDGGTIILNHLHLDVPALKEFCDAISDELATELQCNAYVTPAGSQGFPVHYDTHDVFIAQAHGSKRWKIYDSPIRLPLAGQPHDKSGTTAGDLTLEVELEPGDVLYIPRGFYHEAQAESGMSVHLTLGLMSKSWSELLLEAVSFAALDQSELRRAPEVGFGMDPQREPTDKSALLHELGRIERLVRERPLSEILRPSVIYPREPSPRGRFLETVSPRPLGLDDIVRLDERSGPQMSHADGGIEIVSNGYTVSLPKHVEPALTALFQGLPICIAELPGELDEQSRLILVRKLLETSVLRREAALP